MRGFMLKNSRAEQRDFFVRTARQLWGPEQAAALRETDLIVLVPAFLLSELTVAFQVGFLLYLPFVIIDLIVSNILMAMGMMMVSPVTISMPLKLFLFVMVDGWSRLIQGLVLSYAWGAPIQEGSRHEHERSRFLHDAVPVPGAVAVAAADRRRGDHRHPVLAVPGLTQIQEQTLSFAIKMIVVFGVILLTARWVGTELYNFTVSTFGAFVHIR